VSVITPAASVLLSRGPGSREIYAILRGQQLKFFGGFWAFPGGKLTNLEAGAADPLDARRRAACRELFEETGVLIARHADGSFPSPGPDLDACRHALLKEETTLGQVLRARQLSVVPDDFRLIGEITTPDFAPVRYATTFFVAHLPPGQEAHVWPGELERGEWIDVKELLARFKRGDDLLTPPSIMTLETLGAQPVDAAPLLLGPLFERLGQGAMHPIYFAPSVQMIPLRTNALPPSTHTNAYLVGTGPRYLIDPGPSDADEQGRLFGALDEQVPGGKGLTAVLLTHHHPDHVGAAAVCRQRYGAPIWAHPRTAQKLEGRIAVERTIEHGALLPLGPHPAHGGPWHLCVHHTPGHASGHVVFLEPYYRLLFAGDMISTMSSIVVGPPDGDLAAYLRSLHEMRALPARLLLPAHGNVSARPQEVIDAALEHRAKREQQLLDALAEGPAAVDDLTARLYRGTPEALMRLARAQLLAGLLKLQAEERARPLTDERWQLTEARIG
jgi:glyoxylase-like metal-dependent hydrolase (beta-lactamase superfamily II)/8-oxo-dGTP pyrophosphatase MutT (NUDIX family)